MAVLKPRLLVLTVAVLLVGGLPESGAALSGPAVLEAMLEQFGPAKTLKVRQRVESTPPAPEDALGAAALGAAAPGTVGLGAVSPETEGPSLLEDASSPLTSPGTGGLPPGKGAWPPPAQPADDARPQVPEIPPVVMEELTYQLPGGFRAEIHTEAIHRLYLEVDGEALLVVDDRIDPKGGGWFEDFKDLFLFKRRLVLHRHLAIKGVDLAVTSLGLWENQPVYVLGARFPDAAPSQIWVDKETLLPLRWLWQTAPDDRAGGSVADASAGTPPEAHSFEIRYDRWQLFGKRRYPLRVRFFENHVLVRTVFAEAVRVNPEVDADLMDLAALRATALPPEEAEVPGEESGDAATDEIQEAIDLFKKRFE